ncbi:MAG: hypothetical protein PVI90_12900 [Desulfobacteraceae bacterium]|jgi:hypothetical protein
MDLLKKFICLSLLTFLLLYSSASIALSADVKEDVNQFMTTYFQALKGGDVATLLDMLTEPVLETRRVLLEKNTAYPDHLREYYQNANFTIISIDSSKTDIIKVDVEYRFGEDVNSTRSRFFLRNEAGQFKIYNEIKNE